MKIGVLIPTRGDRKAFLKHAKYLIGIQTRAADVIEIVDDKPKSEAADITYRYRVGCERLVKKGCDVIFFWEDDDWYAKNYIEAMVHFWENLNKPTLLGLSDTTYYHIGLGKYLDMKHPNRSSAFSTMVTKDVLSLDFGNDSEPFFDLHLWSQKITKASIVVNEKLCIGIKHGTGACGGKAHSKNFPYKNTDENNEYLKSIVDEKSFNFYRKFSDKI